MLRSLSNKSCKSFQHEVRIMGKYLEIYCYTFNLKPSEKVEVILIRFQYPKVCTQTQLLSNASMDA